MKKIFLDGQNVNVSLDANLATFAQHFSTSQGREHSEYLDPDRNPFQRDRDRIIHTASFRRLRGKMQVVSPQRGDHFRNRLTHTLEVAQIARDLARQLKLNEDLSEAIALGHDIGHPPFGHVGERALHACMQKYGREFDHNRQSLRVVTTFERRYPSFPGLNLSREVVDGLQKHERGFETQAGAKIFFPHLEMQLVDISDEIAYLAADLDDGMRAEYLDFDILRESEICTQALSDIVEVAPEHRASFIRRIIKNLLVELVTNTQKNLKKFKIVNLEDVQNCSHFIVAFSEEYYRQFVSLKRLLMAHYYTQPEVLRMSHYGAKLITEAFEFLEKNPEALPTDFLRDQDEKRRICDYIAGMTDGYLEEFVRTKL